MKSKFWLCVLIPSLLSVPLGAVTFDDLSRDFIVLESLEGRGYLCARVRMAGGFFAVTSQSLFFDPVPVFRLKSFNSGEVLGQGSFEISLHGDFVRIKLEGNQSGTGMELGSEAETVYSMIGREGIVYKSEVTEGNLYSDSFRCTSGSPVVDIDGRFVGVASRTDDGMGEIKLKAVVLEDDVEWLKAAPQSFTKQVYSLHESRVFYQALNHVYKRSGVNKFIEINTDSHRQLIPWLKEQNEQAFINLLAKPLTREPAVRDHTARCLHYMNLRRIANFFSSNAISARSGRWPSEYLRENAGKVFDLHDSGARRVQAELKRLIEKHPSIKEKL
ncbi:MAG: hypothetical protein JW808_06085 [Victivallales bacterium]|nr:hypothetical protein [Victivallales bacterium]